MTYENITLRKQNLTMIDGYFYMLDQDQDAMIVKTDDGTQAYSYPLDTTVANEVVSMEYDGRNFWTLENPGSDTIVIKRWSLENYVLKQRDIFNMIPNSSHKYNSQAMAIEHYHLRIFADIPVNSNQIYVYQPKTFLNDSGGYPGPYFDLPGKLQSGTILSLGPNLNGQREDISVSTAAFYTEGTAGAVYQVGLNARTQYAYDEPESPQPPDPDYREKYGDPSSFFTSIWIFNNWNGVSSTEGALYKINAYTGGYQTKFPGGEYKSVKSSTFYSVPNYIFDRDWQRPDEDPLQEPATNWPKFQSLCYVRTTNTIFLNPDDFSESYGSMTMDNLKDTQDDVLDIYDMTMEGVNVYRLQLQATYYGETYTFAGSNYSYQLSTLEPFITSISLRADPAILPANLTNQSTITAIVKDQFNLPIEGKDVYFTDDDAAGIVSPDVVGTDSDGEAITKYTAGNTAREVKITATAAQGGINTPTD